jgi:hypothetical protein
MFHKSAQNDSNGYDDASGRDCMVVGSTLTLLKVVSSNPSHGEVYSIQHYVIKFMSGPQQRLIILFS